MILIENPECNDGLGQMCDILPTNQVYTLIDDISLDSESLTIIHKIMPDIHINTTYQY